MTFIIAMGIVAIALIFICAMIFNWENGKVQSKESMHRFELGLQHRTHHRDLDREVDHNEYVLDRQLRHEEILEANKSYRKMCKRQVEIAKYQSREMKQVNKMKLKEIAMEVDGMKEVAKAKRGRIKITREK